MIRDNSASVARPAWQGQWSGAGLVVRFVEAYDGGQVTGQMIEQSSAPAVSAFPAEHLTALLRTAVLLTGSPERAEDLVQTALRRSIPRWSTIAVPALPAVRAGLVREHLSTFRRLRVVRGTPTQHLPHGADDEATDSTALRVDLLAALARLTQAQRTILVLRYLDDLPIVDVAALLKCTSAAVRSQTRHALAAVRARATGRLAGHLTAKKDVDEGPVRAGEDAAETALRALMADATRDIAPSAAFAQAAGGGSAVAARSTSRARTGSRVLTWTAAAAVVVALFAVGMVISGRRSAPWSPPLPATASTSARSPATRPSPTPTSPPTSPLVARAPRSVQVTGTTAPAAERRSTTFHGVTPDRGSAEKLLQAARAPVR